MLGESVVAIAVGSRGLALDADLLIAALLGLAVASCLWWSLFVHELPGAERALTATKDSVKRVRRVLAGLFYAFVPVLLGILVLAAGVEHAIGHATEAQDLETTLLLSGGPALFLLGTAGLRASMGLRLPLVRVALAVVVMLLAPLGLVNAAIQLAALAVVMVAALVTERRFFSEPSGSTSGPSGEPSDSTSGPSGEPSGSTPRPSGEPSGSPAA